MLEPSVSAEASLGRLPMMEETSGPPSPTASENTAYSYMTTQGQPPQSSMEHPNPHYEISYLEASVHVSFPA